MISHARGNDREQQVPGRSEQEQIAGLRLGVSNRSYSELEWTIDSDHDLQSSKTMARPHFGPHC